MQDIISAKTRLLLPQVTESTSSSPGIEETEIYPDALSGDEAHSHKKHLSESEKSSFAGVLFNLSNTIVGGSVLAVPYIINQLGIIIGTFVFILGAVLITFCAWLLQKTKNLSGHGNYITIAKYCFGKKGEILLSICLLISNLGSCIVFLSVFAVVVQNILNFAVPACGENQGTPDAPMYCQRSILVLIGGLIIFPFTCPKNISKLKIISLFKMISVSIFGTITICYCIHCISNGSYSHDVHFWPSLDQPVNMIASIAEVILTYIFTYNQFAIYKSMKNPSDARFFKAVNISMGTIAVIFIAIGISGYIIFGAQTNNLLQNFTLQELGPGVYMVLNSGFLIFSITSYPPAYFAPRNVMVMFAMKAFGGTKIVPGDNPSYHEEDSKPITSTRRADIIYAAVVVISNGIIIIVAIFAPNINDLFGVMGSVAANALVFLFPPAFYLTLSSKKAKWRRMSKLMIVIGIIVGVTGLTCNIIKIFVEGQ